MPSLSSASASRGNSKSLRTQSSSSALLGATGRVPSCVTRRASIGQTKAVGKQRVIVRVATVNACLLDIPWPRKRQLAGKVVAHLAAGIAEQQIGDASTLGTRQPCHNESIGGIHLRCDPHRSSRQKNRDYGNAALPQTKQKRKVLVRCLRARGARRVRQWRGRAPAGPPRTRRARLRGGGGRAVAGGKGGAGGNQRGGVVPHPRHAGFLPTPTL